MKLPPFLNIAPNRVWRTYSGGATLDQINGTGDKSDNHYPEDWLVSTTRAVNPGHETTFDEGLSKVWMDGKMVPLKELLECFPIPLLGETHHQKYGANPKFLLKFLDSAIRLPLQCHPTREFSHQFLQTDAGKTEGYVILGSRTAEPYIYLGFQQPVTPAELKTMIVNQNTAAMLQLFQKIPVKTGDVFLVPGGLPHAIGEGVLMIEIMEPTDFAVRIEFKCGNYVLPEAARFMGRTVDFALSMFDFTPRSVEEIQNRYFVKPALLHQTNLNQMESLFDAQYTDCFQMERITVFDRFTIPNTSLRTLIVTGGEGTISAGTLTQPLKKFDRLLIPAQTREITFQTSTSLELVAALPPK